VPVVVHPDGTVTVLRGRPGFIAQAKVGAAVVIHVLFSRGVRPYEVAIGVAILKALEKSFGFHIGI
jgi:hypothetical protein